jgi:predicted dehydrogenase
MSTSPIRLGILGCGDFLRWNESALRSSTQAVVSVVFDPDNERKRSWGEKLKARQAANMADVLSAADVDVVCLFVPPWVRRGPLIDAAKAGKSIITTKPLAPKIEDCQAMISAVAAARVKCGVIYNRTRSASIETLKDLFDSGEIGKLSLFKQDWIHSYPRWNSWATDPERNGGPFMDAMIHNLNAARYLMGRPASGFTFFADNHSQKLQCADTGSMKLDFTDGGSAHLFITWAADLATYKTEGNDREHIDIFYLVTDQGWRVTVEGNEIHASRRGESKRWQLRQPSQTIYDAFAQAVRGGSMPRDLPSLEEAAMDIALVRAGARTPGQRQNPPILASAASTSG